MKFKGGAGLEQLESTCQRVEPWKLWGDDWEHRLHDPAISFVWLRWEPGLRATHGPFDRVKWPGF